MNEEHVCNAISDAELERRWAAVRAKMAEQGIDALVLQNNNDFLGGYVKWFTDVSGVNAYPKSVIFPLIGGMTLVEQGPIGISVPAKPGDALNRGVEHIHFTASYSSARQTTRYDAELVVETIKKSGWRTVGAVNTGGMYYDFYAEIAEHAGVKLIDFTEEVDLIKAIKSPEEIALIRRTATMQDEVMQAVADFIRPGMKGYEITAFAQYQGQLRGSEQGIFLGSTAPVGRPSLFRPRHLQERPFDKGDHLTLLIENSGPGGFYCELARTFTFGPAPAAVSDALAAMVLSQENTIKHLHAGQPCRDVFAAHNEYQTKHGYPAERRLYCHGQGYDLVERPLIRDDEPMLVTPGMNIVVHPGFADETIFMTVCDNFLINETGAENIHAFPKAVIEL